MDFYQVVERETKRGINVMPDFVVRPSKDLMVRAGSFYAIWDEGAGLWSTDEYDVQRLIDADLYAYAATLESNVHVRALSSFASSTWKDFRSFIGSLPNSHQQLDGTLTFADTVTKKRDYASKRLPYSLKAGTCKAYDEMMSVLYSPEEREKLEWAIGAIISGDSKKIQKFLVLYGEAGTGKGTFLNVLSALFQGYTASFDAKALTGNTNAFSTESFKSNPLVAIQHDGDLSRIEDNTKLNSIVSHEEIVINEKYKTPYSGKINALLFVGTNQSVKITDARSGLIRRLIDVHPTGDTIEPNRYEALMQSISFELGEIAQHCLDVYRKCGMNYYSRYKPTDMILRTDVFYNFVLANYDLFKEHDGTTLAQAWALYKTFCDEGGYDWRLNKGRFRDELRNYFQHFAERGRVDEAQVWNLFTGFRADKLTIAPAQETAGPSLLLDEEISIFDQVMALQPAQYASEKETPKCSWSEVTTSLSELDTSKIHYVKPGSQHVVIDFDLKADDGEKNLTLNLEAASLWPPTYSELSKGGQGIHLHYNYEGDISELSSQYGKGIEVKTFAGDASLRRRLSKCNNIPIATISSGLPHKERRMIDTDTMKSEKGLRDLLNRNLRKEIHPGTKSSIDFIWKILEDAFNSGMHYDVTDMRGRILAFANNSTNNAPYCVKSVMTMKFASESATPVKTEIQPADDRLVFFDVEVFPNLFVVCWKYRGDSDVVSMINPAPAQIEELIKFKLVGFNNRKYDNHIAYARIMGYSEEQLFLLSQRIIAGEKGSMFGDAYNLSHADIYDFSSKKQGLKRFQIELGLDHQELGFPWDKPVDPKDWQKVVDYCSNDVVTTEQVFEDRIQDYVARQILADLSGLLINDTTQRHTAKIIFGDDKNPQDKFKYTDLSEMFPGYEYDFGKSTYKEETAGEGGYVYAEPGMYTNVAVLDVASMHPTSIELLDMFGPYTKNFSDLKTARVAIKRKDYSTARKMLGGVLVPYLSSEADAKALSYALKIIINIVYGLTSASFPNPFRDPRNKDNIAAKRGALFMINLKEAVRTKDFKVVHIKTDSIKIPDATPEIIQFITDFGARYGYEFEHEVTYDKFCLVNDAVYIAKTEDGVWHATGAQFAEPYVFKTLFSGEEITFDDYVQIKTVTAALYLDFGSGNPHFVGRAGAFVPVRKGTGGGLLLRGKDNQFHAAGGTKGFEWREAVTVRSLGLEEDVDISYYTKMVDAALEQLAKYGDPEWFRS